MTNRFTTSRRPVSCSPIARTPTEIGRRVDTRWPADGAWRGRSEDAPEEHRGATDWHVPAELDCRDKAVRECPLSMAGRQVSGTVTRHGSRYTNVNQ